MLPILPTSITHLQINGLYNYHLTIPPHVTHLRLYYRMKSVTINHPLEYLSLYYKITNLTHQTISEIQIISPADSSRKRPTMSKGSYLAYYVSVDTRKYFGLLVNKVLEDRYNINNHNTTIKQTPFYDII